jgi:hypothetical protein
VQIIWDRVVLDRDLHEAHHDQQLGLAIRRLSTEPIPSEAVKLEVEFNTRRQLRNPVLALRLRHRTYDGLQQQTQRLGR